MKGTAFYTVIGVSLFFLVWALPSSGGELSTAYEIPSRVLDNGGSLNSSTSFYYVGSTGQSTPLGFVQSLSYRYQGGYIPQMVIHRCRDIDEDGYGDPPSRECFFHEMDCNDLDEDTYPGAADPCDGVDQDCDGADGIPEIIDNEIDDDCDSFVDEPRYGDLGPFGEGDGRWTAADFSLSLQCINSELYFSGEKVVLLDVAPAMICDGAEIPIRVVPLPDGLLDVSDLSILIQAADGYIELIPECP